MKTLIIILILFSFLQATILPLDLVLIVIILRAYLRDDSTDLFLGFGVGLLISLLTFSPLGFLSLIYLSLVQVARMSTKTNFSHHILTVVPLIFILLSAKELILGVFLQASTQIWPKVILESLLALPLYILLRFWEERFSVRDIKLRV